MLQESVVEHDQEKSTLVLNAIQEFYRREDDEMRLSLYVAATWAGPVWLCADEMMMLRADLLCKCCSDVFFLLPWSWFLF